MSKTAEVPTMTIPEAEEHIRELSDALARLTDRLEKERERRKRAYSFNDEVFRVIRVALWCEKPEEAAREIAAYLDSCDLLRCPECGNQDCDSMLDPDGLCPKEGDICPSCTGAGDAPGWTCPRCGGGGQVYS